MGSSFTCDCGQRININLFSGNNIAISITDEYLDNLDDKLSNQEIINKIIMSGNQIYECKFCKCIYIKKFGQNEILSYRINENDNSKW